jgi:protein-tyrosine phosphatase
MPAHRGNVTGAMPEEAESGGPIVNVDEILTGRLWVGSCIFPQEVSYLADMGISHVLNLQTDADMSERDLSLRELTRAYDERGIELIRRPTPDFSRIELFRNLGNCVAALDGAMQIENSRVYVHCTAGINRAPTVAAAWLMRSGGMPPGEAYRYVDSRRRCSMYLDVLDMYQAELQAGA